MTAKAVVLFSGGLDSTTVLSIARSQGFEIHALTFRYGQRHEGELRAAARIAERLDVRQHVLPFDLRQIGGSALTSDDLVVPKHDAADQIQAGVPVTYVPARNTIFLSFALALCEVLPASDLFLGVNALDYSGYPDCRPAYIAAFQRLANLATKAAAEGIRGLTIHTPLLHLTKAQIIRQGLALGVDYGMTRSCYDPEPGPQDSDAEAACGRCDACLLRLRGFREAGVSDPAPYVRRS